MRLKIPFTKNQSINWYQLIFAWVVMILFLILPFISKPFIFCITWLREKIEGLFKKKTVN